MVDGRESGARGQRVLDTHASCGDRLFPLFVSASQSPAIVPFMPIRGELSASLLQNVSAKPSNTASSTAATGLNRERQVIRSIDLGLSAVLPVGTPFFAPEAAAIGGNDARDQASRSHTRYTRRERQSRRGNVSPCRGSCRVQ